MAAADLELSIEEISLNSNGKMANGKKSVYI